MVTSITAGIRSRRWFLSKERLFFAACVVPALIVVVAVQIYPLGFSVWIATKDWVLTASDGPSRSVGLGNFRDTLSDDTFRRSLRNSAIITGFSVSISVILGTALAFFTRAAGWFNQLSRTILIVPLVVAPVAAGTLWRIMLNPRAGLINTMLDRIGIDGPIWLGKSTEALISVTVVEIWIGTPFVLLVISAALTTIPNTLLEAAAIDGANRWRSFLHIELPLITPVLLIAVMFRALDSLLSLDTVFTLTQGGPGFSTYTLSYLIYNTGLREFDLGAAAATSWIFMAIAATLMVLTFWLQARWQRT